jgi:S1-C subfamily serine protease
MNGRKQPNKNFLIAINVFVIIAMLACGVAAEVVPPTATPTVAPPTATPLPTNTPLPTPKPIPTVSELSKATVQILAMYGEEAEWWGSGTFISSDGLILTNAHVASIHAPGLAIFYDEIEFALRPEPDALVIAMIEDESRPPKETYIAEVVNADGALDLAVIRIVSDLEGNPVDTASLNLPFVELGDSDQIQLGESVRIFGFPGIGGETITFTEGTVSGFETQENVGDRAFIKTDTEISGGNSGGLAVNEAGQIIGVPTWTQSSGSGAVIGRLRAINYAKDLIEAGDSYRSEYVEEGSGRESWDLTTWAEDYGEDNCPIGPLERYASGALAVVSVWSFEQMTDGEDFLVLYYIDQQLDAYTLWAWEDGVSAECFALSLHNYGNPLPNGDYRIEVYAGKGYPLIDVANTTIGPVQSGDIKLKGKVVDSYTGKGIPGASFVILNPGVDLDTWIDNPTEEDIYSVAITDAKGNYALPDGLERLVRYPVVVVADGYYIASGFFEFGMTDPSQITLNDIALEPR